MRMLSGLATLLLFANPVLAFAGQLQTPESVNDPQEIVSKIRLGLASFSVDKFFLTRSIGHADWSPDGNTVAFNTNISGRNNIWTVPASGGWPLQLGVSNQRQLNPAWSPDSKWIAYQSDYDGNEQWDIFLVSPSNGAVINLTNTPDISEEDPSWSPDGHSIAYAVKPKASSTFEIDVLDINTKKLRHITSNTAVNYSNMMPIWSSDGKWIAYTQEEAKATDSNIFITELATGKTTKLIEHNAEKLYIASSWSPDGKKLLIDSNAENNYENCALLDIATKKIDWLTDEKWEIRAGSFTPDGKQLTWTANIDGSAEIYLHDIASGTTKLLPCKNGVNTLAGAGSPFCKDGSRLLFLHNGPDAPDDLWVYDLNTKQAYQLTNSMVAGLQSRDLVKPQLVHYPSRDGKWQISAFVYTPYNLQRDGRNPAIIYVHGGPSSQAKNNFNKNIQYLVNRGYLVLTPNYRGSTGYGEEFKRANLFDMGGGDFQDVLAGADWIKKTGFVDPGKMVVMGASYGGYMTMMALSKAPEIWGAGVAIVPFVNWFSEVKNEDPALAQWDLASMGDPEKNKALWQERSPINFADQIKAPFLLIAGGNDARCPKSESEQVLAAVKKRGGIADLKIYANEGHQFSKIENQIDCWNQISRFLQDHVPSQQGSPISK